MARLQRLLGIGMTLAMLAPLAIAQDTTSSTTTKPAHPHSINSRQKRQEKRIAQGVNSGQLNAKEAARLEAQQKAIAEREARMRESGGKFTKGERTAIQRQENRTSRRIYKQKHDKQTAQ